MSDLPEYVERASKQTFIPPYRASGARIYGFILGSDYRPLQEVCDNALNRPSKGAVDIVPRSRWSSSRSPTSRPSRPSTRRICAWDGCRSATSRSGY